MTPRDALSALHAASLQPVINIPRTRGIYALADHAHCFRYIGSTGDKDFRDRIQNRHTTGSESSSHKFSWAYNTGRMYRGPKSEDPEIEADRKAAKDLRTAFIRRHCRAVWLPIDGTRDEIEELERGIIRIAPLETVMWNGMRKAPTPIAEPEALVDALIADLGYGADTVARLERQAGRYRDQNNTSISGGRAGCNLTKHL